jgi:hypothetical protein
MQTKETQQELMSFFQNYIVKAANKAEAINSIGKLLDSFCVKGIARRKRGIRETRRGG